MTEGAHPETQALNPKASSSSRERARRVAGDLARKDTVARIVRKGWSAPGTRSLRDSSKTRRPA